MSYPGQPPMGIPGMPPMPYMVGAPPPMLGGVMPMPHVSTLLKIHFLQWVWNINAADMR